MPGTQIKCSCSNLRTTPHLGSDRKEGTRGVAISFCQAVAQLGTAFSLLFLVT